MANNKEVPFQVYVSLGVISLAAVAICAAIYQGSQPQAESATPKRPTSNTLLLNSSADVASVKLGQDIISHTAKNGKKYLCARINGPTYQEHFQPDSPQIESVNQALDFMGATFANNADYLLVQGDQETPFKDAKEAKLLPSVANGTLICK